ncbi:YihY family inner membrane protein [Facilibium subflavum]|uniref:YihY family inner membrane protein n=1 Tax=Facilibium subflavum TaxID=2219058 RepID=UPI0013C34A11|nr:YihY family inner membrane protein [Facilibium subflavum]
MDYKHYFRRFLQYWVWVFKEYLQQNCLAKASTLALTSLFALVPLLIVSLSILSMLPAFKSIQSQFQAFILQNLMPSTGVTVNTYLQMFLEKRAGLPVTAVIVLVFISIMMMRALEKVLNNIWYVKKERPLMQAILLYWAVLTLGPIFVGSSLGVSSYLLSWQWIGDGIGGYFPLLKLLPFFFNLIAFSFIYTVVPFTNVRLWHAILGGAFMAVLFDVAKTIFAWYVFYLPTYEMLYGALAIIPLFILWVAISWQIFLLGAVVVHALSVPWQQKIEKKCDKFDLALRVLKVLQQAQKEKKSYTLSKINQKALGASMSHLQQVLDKLVACGYIQLTQAQRYCLNCDVSTESLAMLYRRLHYHLDLDSKSFESLSGVKKTVKASMEMPIRDVIE